MTSTDPHRTARAKRVNHAMDARDGATPVLLGNREQTPLNKPDPTMPHTFPRRILLAVTGLSPQVLTETLFALALANPQETHFVPTEIYLVTTVEGAERARLMLFEHEGGRFNRLCEEYGLDRTAMEFGPKNIHEVTGADGLPLHDIVDEAGSAAVADLITETVRRFTADPHCAIHASIAGGRKTMGFYLGYVLSLYGRAQDRLSHVLVSAPFESDHQFYYPPAMPTTLIIKDRPVRTDEARILLADIPFVRLRHGLPEDLLAGKAGFSETVAVAQRGLGVQELVLDYPQHSIRAGGQHIKLPPVLLAFYGWFAKGLASNHDGITCPCDGAPDPDYANAFLTEYRAILGEMGDDDRTSARLKNGMDKQFFEQTCSKLNKKLKEALWPNDRPYRINGHGRPKHYRLAIQTGAVRFGPIENEYSYPQACRTNNPDTEMR